MKKQILLLIFGLSWIMSFAQTDLGYHWKRLFGSGVSDVGRCVEIETDGDNIVAGYTTLSDWINHGGKDIYVGKADPSGIYKWAVYYGGSQDEEAYSILQTSDGGHLIAGYTFSNDDQVSGNHGSKDVWVVKTNNATDIEWQKCYGGTLNDEARCIRKTMDGGYIIAGYTKSADGDVAINHGGLDCWVIKIGSEGTIEWQKTYGGSLDDEVKSIQQTIDGGYILTGYTKSNDGDVTNNHGGSDFWVVKTDQYGMIQWQKTFGGTADEDASAILQTSAGGFIVAGSTKSNNYDVTNNYGGYDYWLIKINSIGDIEWQKTYGGSLDDRASDMQKTNNGSYVVVGSTLSINGDITFNHGNSDYWVLLIDESGNLQTQESFGGSETDGASAVKVASDGNCVVVGTTASCNGDVSGNTGFDNDIWALKTCASIPSTITIADPNYCSSTSLMGPDGFAYYLWSTGEITKNIEIVDGGDYSLVAALADGCKTNAGIEAPDPAYYGDDPIAITRSFYNCDTVWLTATDGFESYSWNNNYTGQSILGALGKWYSVHAENATGCVSYIYYFVPDDTIAIQHQICFITMNEKIEKNVIEIQTPFTLGAEKVNLFRMVDTSNVFEKITEIGPYEESQFVDLQSDPNHHAYTYQLSVNDICGRENFDTSFYTPIFLEANIGDNNKVMLKWNAIQGFSVERVYIYRSNAGGPFQVIDDFPGNVTNVSDLFPPAGINRYQIRYYSESDCSLSKPIYDYAGSNIVQTGVDGINEDMLSSFEIYPNPFKNNFLIKQIADNSIQLIEIYNSAGMKVFRFRPETDPASVNLSQLSDGMYFVKIIGSKNSKIVKVTKAK